ncbi:OmpA family protein [Soonwooa sp.]|uniref:OmpA family protein n=1 Tax=Soonwooa sp. TaxID=1938592 RepID=UPI0028A590B1|nr:OmpA family protein [Soonwooa sp.]
MKKSLLTSFLLFGIFTGNAQIFDRIKNAAKNTAERKAENKSGDIVDKGLDKVEEGIENIFKKKDKSNNSNSQSGNTNSSGANQNTTQNGNTDYSQYKGSTFIPGKNVLFFEDFATARLGTGNTNWHMYEYDPSADFERPNVRTISASGGNWLKMPRKGFVFPNSFKNLPDQFTLEFDLYADPQTMSEMEGGLRANFVALDDRKEYNMYFASEPSIELDVHPHGSTKFVYISAQSEYNSNISKKELLFENTFKSDWNTGAINRVSIDRNGKQVTLYLNGKEMLNIPNGLSKKAQYNLIFSTNMWGDGMYMSNIRLAGNIPNATQEIKTAGKFVTNSIYFDVNSSRIKPESWATLNNTAQAIKATSGNILIVGHTDSDGPDDANLKLSQSRAASVKNTLVREFGIEASRLISDGKGESQPVTSNNTASGKAQNRRVEFIKQ